MKYLVVSDNHGDRNILVEIVNRYVGMVDQMFHCGDSELKANNLLIAKRKATNPPVILAVLVPPSA